MKINLELNWRNNKLYCPPMWIWFVTNRVITEKYKCPWSLYCWEVRSNKKRCNGHVMVSPVEVIFRVTKMTSAQVVETSVTNNSSFQNYPNPDDHTIRTIDTPGFKPLSFTMFNFSIMVARMLSGNHLTLETYQSSSPAKLREKPPANLEKNR